MTTTKQKVKITNKEKIEKAKLIIKYINDYFVLDIQENNRKGFKVIARQLAFYYIKENLGLNLSLIGTLFPKKTKLGYINHATVLYGIRKMSFWVENDPEIIQIHSKIKDDIENISKFTEKEIEKHLLVKEINSKFDNLQLESLVRINSYLNKYY